MKQNLLQPKRELKLFWILVVMLILFNSCATKPPHETGVFKASDLVELAKLDTSFHLDIRYATSNNLEGRPVY